MNKISGSINVVKIDKNKLIPGKQGKYLDLFIFMNDEPDQYGNDGMIVQSVTKEEREAGIKGAILGNVKIMRPREESANQQAYTPSTPKVDVFDDDIPF